MRKLLISCAFGVLPVLGVAVAQPAPSAPPAAQRPAQTEVATIGVNGLICDFCVQSIKKMAGQRSEIARTDVDLDNGRVTITFRPGQTMTDAALRTLITNAGYAVVSIARGRA
jgi:copper chaperone CopZ